MPRIAPFSHWRNIPPPEYVIDQILEHGGLTSVIGPPGVGKSTVVLDMLCHIATGKRWYGFETRMTRVLYLPGEGLSGAVQRILAWELSHAMDLPDDLFMGNGIVQARAVDEAWAEVADYVNRHEIGLVVFDTYARMTNGMDENSAGDAGMAVRRFDKLRQYTSAGVMVVHHTAKGDPTTGRGSSALNGALESELLVRAGTWDTSALAAANNGRVPGKPIELFVTKQKNSEQREDAVPLLLTSYVNEELGIDAATIVGPNGHVDPMQGAIVLARPFPEQIVDTAIRVREFAERFTQQGITRTEAVLAVEPDAYARSRKDTGPYWKLRIAEAIDRALRYGLLQTLTGTDSGQRYIPDMTVTREMARAMYAAEAADLAD